MHFLINSSDRLLAALVSTMTHYVPDVSDVAQPDRSHKGKRDGQREEQQRLLGLSSERLGQRVPLSEQLARILGYVITSMEESLDERARTKNSWPAPLAGQMLSVLATCGGLKEGRHLLELVSKHATVVVGEIPADDVHKLCSAAVKQGDISTAMMCVSYVRTHDPASAPALAAEIASSGQPLEPAVRARLSVLFGNDIFAKQSSENKGSEAMSESSSSSDDSDSDSSSSDDETSNAKKASIEPAIEPKPRNS
ncbi:uncharacterized protein LOC108680951 [Hyalella azteca]|uniref:Uncharacterized protein LOC108680951 n=1 Tax=Hyalella azteca TaxID=294128 RepID=A0A8B7PIN9_HYAAZ|nr:uncharacterized protein LOC108680951 [Hyalella azteca]